MNGKTNGRTVFVTGGAGGIGARLCRGFAEDGFRVAIGYRTREREALALADELCAAGGQSMALFCDVTDFSSVVAAHEKIAGVFGFTDTLVNNAGIEAYRLLCDETAQGIAQTLAVDLTGTIYACRVFSPDMVARQTGRIVNISSVWGMCGSAMETVYSAAKAGVLGFTKALAAELAPSGITVNAVSPGFIDTPMNARFSDAERAAIADEIPACRFGTPDDVAAVVRFLARADAGYVTGQNIAVTGGYKNM